MDVKMINVCVCEDKNGYFLFLSDFNCILIMFL